MVDGKDTKGHDLTCKDCGNTFNTDSIILEGDKEACPHCGNTGNIWDTVTFL